MADKYSLLFTPIANDDLDRIFDYIYKTLENPTAAYRLMDEIEHKIRLLNDFPSYSGSSIAEDILKSHGYRKVMIDNYIAFYLVNEPRNQIVIMRVLYGARNYIDIL